MKAEELRNDIFDILKDHKIIPTFEMVSDLSQFAAKQSQLPTQEVGVREARIDLLCPWNYKVYPSLYEQWVLGFKRAVKELQSTPQPERLTHEKVVEVLHNTISMEPSELIAGDHRIKDESITEAATAICSLSTEQAEVSDLENIRDNNLLKILEVTGTMLDPDGEYASLFYRLYDKISCLYSLPTPKREKVSNKCQCGEDSTGWTTVMACNICGFICDPAWPETFNISTPKREDAQERYKRAKLYWLNNYMSHHDYKENALRIAAGLPTAPEGGEG